MSKHPAVLFVSMMFLAVSAPSGADDAHAQALYDQNCIKCHGPEIYTREDRMVTSLEGLKRQVQRCELALGLRWFDEEIQGVTDHLNGNYYRFDL
jgi:hypothetical protein